MVKEPDFRGKVHHFVKFGGGWGGGSRTNLEGFWRVFEGFTGVFAQNLRHLEV